MQVPIISWVQAGTWTSESDARNLEGAIDYLLTTGAHSFGTFALKVRGKSMEPEFKEGDTIIVDQISALLRVITLLPRMVVNTQLLRSIEQEALTKTVKKCLSSYH